MFSSLCQCFANVPAGHTYGKRTHAIDRITIHCYVGQCSAETGCRQMSERKDKASCNYVVGYDGAIGGVVDEEYASMCSSNQSNDQRAVTIETASNNYDPYAVTNEAYDAVVQLCADIATRHGKSRLVWIEDKDKALAYEPAEDEMLMTVHRWFAAKACPGDYLFGRMGEIAEEVNQMLQNGNKTEPGEWSQEARDWATEQGLIAGYGDGDMGWTDPVTREQLAVILYRFSKLGG